MPCLMLIVGGITRPVNWAPVTGGAVMLAAVVALACLPMRAGIGVTPEHVLVRTGTGRTRVIPWTQVTGFRAVKTSPKDDGTTICVLTSDGKRLHTIGYARLGFSPPGTWHLLRPLEDERLTWTPGATSTLPPRPPGPEEASPVMPGLISLGIIALVVAAIVALHAGITELGPALRAASGGGTAGYYIPQTENCGRVCTWDGEFRLPDGTVTLQDVGLRDAAASALRAGVPVAARDTGDDGSVFPRSDPGAWQNPGYALVLGCWSGSVLLVLAIRPAIRRLRPGRR